MAFCCTVEALRQESDSFYEVNHPQKNIINMLIVIRLVSVGTLWDIRAGIRDSLWYEWSYNRGLSSDKSKGLFIVWMQLRRSYVSVKRGTVLKTSLEVSSPSLIQQRDLQHDCCFASTGDHQQHHHTQHDVHQDVAEVRSVGRQPGQHRVRTGLLFGAAAGQGERKHPCSDTWSQEKLKEHELVLKLSVTVQDLNIRGRKWSNQMDLREYLTVRSSLSPHNWLH